MDITEFELLLHERQGIYLLSDLVIWVAPTLKTVSKTLQCCTRDLGLDIIDNFLENNWKKQKILINVLWSHEYLMRNCVSFLTLWDKYSLGLFSAA